MKHSYPACALWCAFTLSLALLLPPSLAAPPPKPQSALSQLLQKHRKATGGDAAQREKGAHQVVYDISAGGLTGSMTVYDAPPHRTRTELILGPITMVTGSDGKQNWQQDGAGNVRILGGEELSEQKADTGFSLESYDPLKKSSAGTVTLRPKREAGTGAYILDIRPKGGSQQTLYLDPKTYLVRKSVVQQGGLSGTISILSYATKFGIPVPAHLEIQYAGVPLVIDATLRTASRLSPVVDSLFVPPTPPKDWAFLAPDPATQTASFAFSDENNEVIVPVTINGHPLRLLLDSGAGSGFVTAAAAEAAGLKTEGNLPALGYGGASATGLAAHAALEVGGVVRLSDQTFHVIKDPKIARILSERGSVDGAIGYDFFARLIVKIDYPNKTVTLTDPVDPTVKTVNTVKSVTIPLKLEGHVPTVLASVDGKPPARFLVDTGDGGTVHLYTTYAKANGLLPRAGDPKAQVRQGVGVGGTLEETSTPGHTLTLGTLRLSDLWVATMSGPGISGVSRHAGGIGNLLLRPFVVTFDYRRGRMQVEAPAPQGRQEGADARPRVRLAAEIETLPEAAVPAPPAAPMTLETLLKKHLEALGGKTAVMAIKNTRTVSEVRTGGIVGTITTVFAAPDKEYEEDKLGIIRIVQGYDGKNAWQKDTNGNVRPLAGEELRDLRVQLYFDTNSYVIPGRVAGKQTLRPEPEPETGNWIVDALPEGGKPNALFFDPKTFLIVKEQHLDDNVPVTTMFSDYRTVDGVRFPFGMITSNGAARYDIAGTVLKVTNNALLPPKLFQPPAAGKQFGFVKPGATRATVPFDMDDGEIGFTVKLNGVPSRVFLDSGASGIALSQQTATKLGLKSSGFLEARGYGGSTDLHPVLISTLEVPGAVKLTNVAAIAIDLPDTLNSYFSKPLAGFVGYDLLSHFVVQIDFPKKRMTFIAADRFQPSAADGKAVALELDSNVPSILARIDGLPPSRFLIDTGDEAALRLYSPFVDKYKLDKKYPKGTESVGGGIGGVSRARVSRIGAFTVGGVTFHSLPTDFSLDTKGGASQVNAGAIGATLLSRFVMTLDYPHGRIFFAPGPHISRGFEDP